MARFTLLQMVQKVGDSINSDEIDELDETAEARDIRGVLETTLTDLMTRRDWEFLKDKPMLLGAGNTVVSLAIPSTVTRIQNLYYTDTAAPGNVERQSSLPYISPAEFLRRAGQLDPAASNVTAVASPSTGTVRVYNDRAPSYWTTFDEEEIYFDSYNSAVDTLGIDYTKSLILATISITTQDQLGTWVAPIPERLFTVWLFEAQALASVQLRQFENAKVEVMASRAFNRALENEPVTTNDREEVSHHGRRYSY